MSPPGVVHKVIAPGTVRHKEEKETHSAGQRAPFLQQVSILIEGTVFDERRIYGGHKHHVVNQILLWVKQQQWSLWNQLEKFK